MKRNTAQKNDSIKAWYLAEYPTDTIAQEQLFTCQTFSALIDELKNSPETAGEYLSECDTQIRDRIFAEAKNRMEK